MGIFGKAILTFSALFLSIGTCLYDFDFRHVRNPDWPAHARFHAAAYALSNAAMGLVAVTCLWLLPSGETLAFILMTIPALVFFVSAAVRGASWQADGEKLWHRLPVSAWMTLAYTALNSLAFTFF